MRKKKKNITLRILGFVILIIFLAIAIYIGYKITSGVFNRAKNSVSNGVSSESNLTGEIITVDIPEGATTQEIAEILHEKGLIKSVFSFKLQSKLEGYDGTYKHGTYEITKGLDDISIMKTIKTGVKVEEELKITIPEGYTAKQIGDYLEANNICTSEEFLSAMNTGTFDYEFLIDVPKRENYLEGYLFPDTYFLFKSATPEDIINKMLSRFETVYNEIKDDVASSKYSLDEIITIASIIESEIRVSNERELASAVIYNRLNIDMKLQMCSTVLYAMGKSKSSLLLEDLEIESPYNTYKYSGLPEGPISNPGEASILAAVSPADVDYLYFVLKSEDTGEHFFTSDYNSFLNSKAEYKQQY
ncbi:MAG: endolytic transglycosylase MltG [Lachnospiraceae bacterium]|nr:endolytic transglycosylase MltG [Lachnospiraceae bacterium]